jgi:hypothetical protein
MNQTAGKTFACPQCAKRFSWDSRYTGRKIACTCGRVFLPRFDVVQPATSETGYEFIATSTEPNTLHSARKYPTRKPCNEALLDEPHPIRDGIIPIVLIAGGLLARITQLFFLPQSQTLALTIGLMFFDMLANITIVFLAVYLAAHLVSIEFGSPMIACLKLISMAIFAGATASWLARLDQMPGSIRGLVIGMHFVILCYFFCFSVFFEMDLQESLIATVIVAALQGLLMIGLHQMA